MQFSVVVCTHNYAHFLKDALRSLAAQTFSDFELLIVDDGSTDNTEEVVQQFSAQLRNCIYLRKPHTGLADSRNFGVHASSGTHISFLDADDFWSPDYLKTIHGVFESNPQAELVCCDKFCINASGDIIPSGYPPPLPRLCGRIDTARDLFLFFSQFASPSATTFTKSLYKRTGPFDIRLANFGQDWQWTIRAITKGAFCILLDHKLIIYRRHDTNLTNQVDKMFEAWLLIYTDTIKHLADPEIETYARRFTQRQIPVLLACYPPKESRLLIRQAMDIFGKDGFLKTSHFLTYFGLCSLANWSRRGKHILRGIAHEKRVLDFTASPQEMFEAASE